MCESLNLEKLLGYLPKKVQASSFRLGWAAAGVAAGAVDSQSNPYAVPGQFDFVSLAIFGNATLLTTTGGALVGTPLPRDPSATIGSNTLPPLNLIKWKWGVVGEPLHQDAEEVDLVWGTAVNPKPLAYPIVFRSNQSVVGLLTNTTDLCATPVTVVPKVRVEGLRCYRD